MNPVIVVGLGGTGSHLVEPLARYLTTRPAPPELILVDGDAYGADNGARQRVDPGEQGINKALAQARRLRALLPGLRVRSLDVFLSDRNAGEVIPEGSLVVACPDNHATRLTVSRRCQRLRNAAAVFAGNDRTDGAVQVYVRRNGRSLKRPVEQYHREVAEPRDRNPAELSCEELAARPGGGQVIFANLTAAALALNAVYSLLEGRVPPGEVFFDIVQNRANARERR